MKTVWIFRVSQWTYWVSFLISWNFQMEGSDFRNKVFKETFQNGCYPFRYKHQLGNLHQWILSFRGKVYWSSRLFKKHGSSYRCLASRPVCVHCSWCYCPDPTVLWPRRKPQIRHWDLGMLLLETWSFQGRFFRCATFKSFHHPFYNVKGWNV